MYRPVTEEIPPDEIALDTPVVVTPVGEGGERPCPGGGEDGDEDQPEADHSAVADPGVEFSSSRPSSGLAGQPTNRIQLKWEPHYLTTLPGIMKMLQLILTLTALICATSISYQGMDYLSLPAAWKFRVFTFTSVLSLLSCVGFLFVRATNLARVLPVDWLMMDIVLSSGLSFLYFLSSCMIASASAHYNKTFEDWTSANKLITGVVLGYSCCFVYALHALGIYVRFKRRAQFRHQLLQVDSGSVDSIQPQV